MVNRIYSLITLSIVAACGLFILAGEANAADVSKDGSSAIEEPAADEPSSEPTTDSQDSAGQSSHHHRGDSIDDGAEGG